MKTWCQSACRALCSWTHCRCSRRRLVVKKILWKGTLTRSPRYSRHQRIDEVEINTPVAIDQRAANSLEEAVWSFTTMRSRCRSSLRWRHLPSSTASSFSCLVFVGPLLLNSHYCGTVPLHTRFYYAIGKSTSSKADNPPPFKLRKLLKFLLLPSCRHT